MRMLHTKTLRQARVLDSKLQKVSHLAEIATDARKLGYHATVLKWWGPTPSNRSAAYQFFRRYSLPTSQMHIRGRTHEPNET